MNDAFGQRQRPVDLQALQFARNGRAEFGRDAIGTVAKAIEQWPPVRETKAVFAP